MVLILKVRNKCQGLLCVEGYALRTAGVSRVDTIAPGYCHQLVGIELVNVLVEDVHVHASLPVQLGVLIIKSQQTIIQFKLRCDVVSVIIKLRQIGHRHGIGIHALVILEDIGRRLKHGIIFPSIRTRLGVLLIDAHIGHLLIGDSQQILIVAGVVGIGQREVRGNLNTLADIVIECDAGRESVQPLLDDRARLVVETARDTERCLLASTGYREVVILAKAPLCHGIHPVGIIVILLVFRKCRIIVQLANVRGIVVLLWVEITFFQQHRIVITFQHFISLRLISTCQTK